jgi:hypothetical protein
MASSETPISEPVAAALHELKETIDGEKLSRASRLKVLAAVRRAIVLNGKPGRKHDRIDSAYADYKGGMKGLPLFRKHIPHHDRLSQWRRPILEKRLMNAIHQRAKRERQRQRRVAIRQ